jgi:hypothetical protein
VQQECQKAQCDIAPRFSIGTTQPAILSEPVTMWASRSCVFCVRSKASKYIDPPKATKIQTVLLVRVMLQPRVAYITAAVPRQGILLEASRQETILVMDGTVCESWSVFASSVLAGGNTSPCTTPSSSHDRGGA